MKLAFIILAHNDEINLFRLIKRLLVEDDLVVVHWDKKNPLDIQAAANHTLGSVSLKRLHFSRRVAVDWGRWSMVDATLACLEQLEASGERFDYVVLLSGADYQIRSVKQLKAFFAQGGDKEYIECADPEFDPWVIKGLVKERYLHHHWFSWRDNPVFFDISLNIQKKLGITRKLPYGLKPYFGSQWWALTGKTLQQVLAMSRRGAVRRFFKTTWVPDEMFFQTIVRSLVPQEKIAANGVTFYHFCHQGKPLIFYNDHLPFLTQQDYFFARKLSPQASDLRDQLDHFIDTSIDSARAINGTAKHIDSYQKFMSVQWRGIPGRRIIGRQVNAWYGDLEWNKSPYFVILSYPEVDLNPLRDALNTKSGVSCYGELFYGGYIDYALSGKEHPLYPHNRTALRDMKRPNFLCDMIRANPTDLVGFTLRLPCGNEIEKIVIFDQQATLIFVLPEERYVSENDDTMDWNSAFDNMIMDDYLAEARKSGNNYFVVRTSGNVISDQSIGDMTAYISSLHTGRMG
jgi:hypothetical protein